MTVGERIRAAREAGNITQEELGRVCGVTKQTIFKYENNIIVNIPVDKLESMAAFLSVSPGYLLGWERSASQALDIQEKLFRDRAPTLEEGVAGLSQHMYEQENGELADFSDIPPENREKARAAYELSKTLASLSSEDIEKFISYARYLDNKAGAPDENAPTTMDELLFAEYLIDHGVSPNEYETLPDPGHGLRTAHIAGAHKFLTLYSSLSAEQQKTADDFLEFLSKQRQDRVPG